MAVEFEVVKDESGTLVKRPKKEVKLGDQSFFVDEDAGYNSKLQIDGELFCVREMTAMQYREYQKKEKELNRRERDISKQRSQLQAKAKLYDDGLKNGIDQDEALEEELNNKAAELDDVAEKFVDDLVALHESVVVKHVATWSLKRECNDENKALLSPSIKRRLSESIVRKSRIGQSDADFLGKR